MTTNALIERLAMLACGAEPWDVKEGICTDIARNVSNESERKLWHEWSSRGLYWLNPIGDFGFPGNHWTGTRGRRRRALCRRTVYWLVSKYGYSGEWCK